MHGCNTRWPTLACPHGGISVAKLWELLINPWALLQYAHNMSGAVVTGAFVMAAVGAFYLLQQQFEAHARTFLRVGVVAGIAASLWQVFPSGDLHGKYLARNQPVTTAAMEGLFKSQTGAPIVIFLPTGRGTPADRQSHHRKQGVELSHLRNHHGRGPRVE